MKFSKWLESREWKAFDVKDPLEAKLLKDFSLDNPEDKDQLWNSLVNPLKEAIQELLESNLVYILNRSVYSVENPEIISIANRASRLSSELSFIKGLPEKFPNNKTGDFRYVSAIRYSVRRILSVYLYLKLARKILEDPQVKEWIGENHYETSVRLIEKPLRIIENYRAARMNKHMKSMESDKEKVRPFDKVLSRLSSIDLRQIPENAEDDLEQAITWLENWLIGGSKISRTKALDHLDKILKIQNLPTTVRRDLVFIDQEIKRRGL